MTPSAEVSPGGSRLVLRLLAEARPFRRHIAGIFALSLLAAPLALVTPLPLKIAVDSVIGAEPVPHALTLVLPPSVTQSQGSLLVAVAAMMVGIALLVQLQDLATGLLRTYTGERLLLRLRRKVFEHVQLLSVTYHDRVGTADAVYRIQYDTMAVQYVAVDALVSGVTAVVTVASMIYVTARIDGSLALIAMAVVPPLFLLSSVFRGRLRAQSRRVKRVESSALSVVQEVLTGLRVVKAFGQEQREQERFSGWSSDGVRARVRLQLMAGGYGLLVGMVVALGSGAVLLVGVRRVETGTVTLGELLAVMTYLTMLYGPVKTLAKKAGTLQGHLASAERVFDVLDRSTDVPERPNPVQLIRAKGSITFRDVCFEYEPGVPVLGPLSFDVPAGARVGVVGRTGAGKTTLLSLLTRFNDPTSGQILLDGVDLRDYRLSDLRAQFGVVLQEPLLFSMTIAENIGYARPGAGQSDIERAAIAAGAHDFIRALPRGYSTEVGERGLRLSGGERQRISLARAFLKDAPVLILDEPTSSVDAATEAQILNAMERLMAGRTTLLVSHRRASLRACEVVLHIDGGRCRTASPVPGALDARRVP